MKFSFFSTLLILFTLSAFSQQVTDTVSTAELADRIIQEAMKYKGHKYRYGGSSASSGFDCSGFTSYIYSKFGYTLDHSSKGQAKDGRPVEGSLSDLQKGDIVVFGSRRKSKTVGHVGIFIALDKNGEDFTFIHSSTSNGVIVSHMKEPYYDGRFLCARRIIPDFIASDTTNKDYTFDINNSALRPDTLVLSDGDKRILLFENGKWAVVNSDGKVSKPEGHDKILLDPNTGNWNFIKESTKVIPSMSNQRSSSYSETQPTTTKASSTSSTSQVYHTIKSGDTLSALARRYGTTVKAICSLNGISEKTILQLGKKLRVK